LDTRSVCRLRRLRSLPDNAAPLANTFGDPIVRNGHFPQGYNLYADNEQLLLSVGTLYVLLRASPGYPCYFLVELVRSVMKRSTFSRRISVVPVSTKIGTGENESFAQLVNSEDGG
jgi:hypothetical protein